MNATKYYVHILAACAFVLNPQIAASQGTVLADAVWTDGNGNTCVAVHLQGHTWDEATADVAALLPGYRLASITSQAEQDFVDEFLLNAGLRSQFWIGGYQVSAKPEPDPAAGWRWVTGEPWDYTNWGFVEPNNAGDIEDYLTTSPNYGWNDEGTAVGSVYGYLAESQGFTPSVVSASPTYPSGTSFEGFVSITDNELGPFSGASVHFRGARSGGTLEVYRYRLDFDQTVVLHSIIVEGAAWAAETFPEIDEIRILDERETPISEFNALAGSHSFQTVEIPGYDLAGRTFFIEEVNGDTAWRYRSNIAVSYDIEQSFDHIGDVIPGVITDVRLATGSSGIAGVLLTGGLLPGVEGFVDRVGQPWLGIPSQLVGADFIQTAQDNADEDSIAIEVTVSAGTILHMLIPDHDDLLPTGWMQRSEFGEDWVNTGALVHTSWSNPAQVWSTASPLQAGTYTFRETGTDRSFYGIAATQGEVPQPPPHPPKKKKSGGTFGWSELLVLFVIAALRSRVKKVQLTGR